MTPQEKAEELVNNFIPYCTYNKDGLVIPVAKACAIILCDEIIDLADRASDYDGNMWRVPPDFQLTTGVLKELEYWQQVKQQINKYGK